MARHEIVTGDPVALADKPKRPLRIPIWLEKEEQARFEATLKDRRNIPINIFGNNIPRMTETRRRYEPLFGLLLNSGLRISEALGLKVADVRLVEETTKSVRVIGKGDQERRVPLPEAFGAVFRFWLKAISRNNHTCLACRVDKALRVAIHQQLTGMVDCATLIHPTQFGKVFVGNRLKE